MTIPDTILSFLSRRSLMFFSAFKSFKAYAENHHGLKIKALQDDKGGEYMSNEMKQYLDENGIEALHTVRASPQQNGVAECANRSLDEGVITLLKEAGLPPIFWGEALACFVHTRNRCPTSSHPYTTPYELWNGSNPTVETAWVHVGKDKRKKLQSHTIKCGFLSYPTGHKGWKFWDPVGKKCIISRDVIFDERPLHPATSTPPTLTSPSLPITPPITPSPTSNSNFIPPTLDNPNHPAPEPHLPGAFPHVATPPVSRGASCSCTQSSGS
jgi:hypothetical protein